MNSAAWAGVAAEAAGGVKAAEQAEAPAGVKGKVAGSSLNKLTNQPFY
jgi:hypothetical protein